MPLASQSLTTSFLLYHQTSVRFDLDFTSICVRHTRQGSLLPKLNMLSINRPTPTTVLYTVSSRSGTATLSSRLRTILNICLRFAAGYIVFTALVHEYVNRGALPDISLLSAINTAISNSYHGALLLALLSTIPLPYRLAFTGLVTWLTLHRFHTSESLLVIRGLGVQTSTSSPSYIGTSSTRFIPTSSIQDIFIHEAFKGFEVRFYLSIVVEGEEGVVVVFPVRQTNRCCCTHARHDY